MNTKNLNQQTWYRVTKLLFIIAFLFSQGIGAIISYEIANDSNSVIHCDNGKIISDDYLYLSDDAKLEVYKKCDLTSYLIRNSNVSVSLTEEQRSDLRERVTEMQNNNELQGDMQIAVNEFSQIYANTEKANDPPIKMTKEDYIQKFGHDPYDTFITRGGESYVANFTLAYEPKYKPLIQSEIYLGIFLLITFVFWLLRRMFFYAFIKENFFKL